MDFIEIINNVGFPIAAYLILFFYMKDQTEKHKEEIDGLRNAFLANTEILSALKEVIEQWELK